MKWRRHRDTHEDELIIVEGQIQPLNDPENGTDKAVADGENDLKTVEIDPDKPPQEPEAVLPGLYLIESGTPKHTTTNTGNHAGLSKPCPSYIEDDDPDDLEGFQQYLKDQRLSKRYGSEMVLNVRALKRQLGNRCDDPQAIQQVLEDRGSQAKQIFAAFKQYANYRNKKRDDHRLLILLTINDIKPPKYKPKQRGQQITDAELRMYRSQAKELCEERDRIGIWLGTALVGIRPSEIKTLELVNGKNQISVMRYGRRIRFNAPAWLMEAIREIPKSQWQLSRHTVRRGVKEYGTHPQKISTAVGDTHLSRPGSNSQ